MPTISQVLEPGFLKKLDRLDLIARLVVEGFITGLHRSPYHGFSVEFAEHRPYMPGDPLRHVDWKLVARTDRYYLKTYEEETNLKAYILLDISRSMAFSSRDAPAGGRRDCARAAVSKLEYAVWLAAALSYLMLKQQDAVGLLTFDEQVRRFIPPRSALYHLNVILGELARVEPSTGTSTHRIFQSLAERIKRRGLIIVISDLLDEPGLVMKGLKHFRGRKHEVILFHVADPWEIRFPYSRNQVFIDLETGEKLPVFPEEIRKKYLEKFDSLNRYYRRQCRENRIDYVSIITSHSLERALMAYLRKRERLS